MKCCTPSGFEGQEQQKDETNKEIVKAAVVAVNNLCLCISNQMHHCARKDRGVLTRLIAGKQNKIDKREGHSEKGTKR